MSTATPAQHGMWLTERLGLAATAYHMPLPVWLDGPLDATRLADAVAAAVARHPVLSCAFTEDDGELRTVAAARTPSLQAGAAPDDLAGFVRERTLAPFDLSGGPLIRFDLVPVGPERHLLLIVAHHLVFDGESKEILLADLATAYSTPATPPGAAQAAQRAADSGKPLPRNSPDPVPGHESGAGEGVSARAGEHWAAYRMPGEPSLPGLRGTTAPGATAGAIVPFSLDAAGIRAAAAELGATTFETVLAGLLTLLDRYGDPAPVVAVDLGTRPADGHDRVGLHVNELPVALPGADPAEPVTARERVALVRRLVREIYPLRAVPLSRAVSGLAPRAALTPVSISYRRRVRPEPVFAGLDVRVEWTAFHHAARNALHVQVLDDPAAPDLPVLLHVDPARLDPADAARIGAHLRTLLDGFAQRPDAPLHDLDLLDPSEHELLAAWNDTRRPVPGPRTLHELVDAWIAARPDTIAVVAADSAMTYAQLDAEAAAVTAQLRARGIGPGDLVAVCLPRTSRLLPALLGVLRCGAAYLPLDPEHPAARREALVADACPAALLVADGDGATVLGEVAPRAGSGVPATPPAASGVPLVPAVRPDPAGPVTTRAGDAAGPHRHEPGLCYVIYTSGSTGRPKGVAVEHRSVVNLLHALPEVVPTGPGDVWLAVAPAAFDMSVPELWLPLVTGGTVVLATSEQARDGELLLKLLRLTGVTHAHLTPSTWRRLVDAGFAERGVVAVCGAEALPAPLAAELRSRTKRLVNLYGPTETTVWSTAADLTGDGPVTIGRPLANTTAYVLDAGLRLLPYGVVGELCLGGAGVARGYLGRPELTAARFVDTAWGRLYRTGDRVRRLPDGSLEFHGRADDQLKVRGHRIEPGEVEAFLRAAESVVDAAVTVSADGDALVAYLVGAPDPARLREQLAAGLPGYLVPSVFTLVEQLPRNANGKLDRAALAGLAGAPLAPPTSPRPYTGLALQVYEIWREVLGHGEIGPDDDLFDLGGHSLTVTKIAARLRRRLGVDLPLHVFFDTPTINGIVAAADR